MKCFTNRSNPISLKLLLTSSFAGKSIQVEYVSLKEWKAKGGKSLPVVELENGDQIFSSNAVARSILIPSESISATVDLWLDWESSVLLPALVKFCKEKSNENVPIILEHIDSKLKNKEYLVDNEINVADIVVWSSVYCILSQPNLVSEYLSHHQSIVNWFQKIRKHELVEKVLREWTSDSGAEILKALAESFWLLSVSNTEKPETVRVNDENSVSPEELRLAEEAWSSKSSRPLPKIFSAPVLPKKGEKNVLITSALPYVNNVPHLGNIIGCVLSADVFARYCRLRNWNALYIGGTDEFGTATETKALEEKLTPQQICDKYYVIHRDIYSWFNISFDHFGRTTTPQQKEITQEFFLDVHKNKFTSIASVEQLLCVACDRFLADRFVEGICPNCKFDDARGDQCDGCGHLINAIELISPRCKLCGNTPIVKNSDQIFLELPKIEPVLRDYIEKVSPQWSHNARTITNTWLKDGLKARCITRDLKWGTPVPLPGFENKVFYVWFDAPIGYVSITACYTDQWRQWWQPSKETPISYYEFMAKDNVPFHSVMFPATLLAINKDYQMATHIMATEYLNYEDGKFSKSRGVGVFGTDAKNTGISADIFRFYLLYVRPESQDSSFSWLDFATKNNTELLNNIGNFVNRALVFAEKFFGGVIPAICPNVEEFTLLALLTKELHAYNSALEKGKLRDGIKFILNVSRHGNQYMQGQKPWVLVKGTDEEKTRAGTVIGMSCNISCLIAIMIQPYMPSTSAIMRQQMNVPDNVLILTDEINILLQPGHKIGKPSPLFTKIEQSTVDSLKNQFAGRGKPASAANGDKKSNAKSAKNSAVSNPKTIEEMEAAILKQGNLIREMKSKGVEKSEFMPHVTVLKDMKKQYEDLKKAISENSVTNGNS